MPAVITTEFRVDTFGEYPWSTIDITYTDGVETSRVTVFDSGLIRTDERNETGMTRQLVVEAAGGTRVSIETLYNETTHKIESRATIYTNGQTLTDNYTDGVLSSTVRTDPADSAEWTQVTTTFDLVDGGYTVETQNDNGQTTTDVFDTNGKIVSRSQVDGTGELNSAGWSEIATAYDSTGAVTQKDYLYDDGTQRAESYTNGKISTVVQTDSNTSTWDTITETFDASGVRLTKIKVEDDGDTTSDIFTNGVLTQSTVKDVADNGALDWDTATRYYDLTGALVSDYQLMDNGLTVARTFVQLNGSDVVSSIIQTDATGTGSTVPWSIMADNYGDDGIRDSLSITYDDGRVSNTTFENAVKVQQVITEGDGSQTLTRNFAAGQITDVVIEKSNGVLIETNFDETGLRSGLVLTDATGVDSTAAWSTIERTYVAGDQTSRTMTYDDGRISTTTYVDGVVASIAQTDGAQTETNPGAAAWTSIDTLFDSAGNLDQRTTLLDNGRETVVNFTAGVRSAVTITDKGVDVAGDGITGTYAWDTIDIVYHDGGEVAASRNAIYDNGDAVLFLYDTAGNVTDRVQYDGDASNAWELRITTYDSEGVPSLSYADQATIPAAYADYFAFA